jgi:D-alanyl-D-alanine carboxypeptidase
MGTCTRAGAAALLVVALAACTGPDTADRETSPAAASGSSTASLSSALPWPAAPTSTLAADRASKMVAEMQRWVDKELMPGATAAVVSPEGTWAAAVGVDGQGTKLEPTSGLALGQVTQTFVAAEALLLAEQAKLNLDAPAAKLVPVAQLANGATTRHLLSHRAAVPEPSGDPYAAVFTAPDTAWSAEQFLEPVPKATAPPGKTFAENPANYVLAGLVVEQASGRTAADAIKADLWTPLGLQRLAYQDAQQLPEPIAAPGEDEDLPNGQTGRPYLPFRSFVSAIAASHGVAGDAASVATWGYDLYGGQILKPASVAQLIDFDYPDGRRFGMATIDFTGRNWDQYSIDGYGMRAATPGYRSVLAVYPAHHLSVAILTPSAVDVLPYVRFIVNAGSLLN